MAEAESFKGKQTYSLTSHPQEYSISLQATEATKAGVKEDLGQYDAKGVLRTSSLKAKKRLRAMMES
jgi:hypothetical protein